MEKLNILFDCSVSQHMKQLFIYLVNVYVHNIYGIKLRYFFQDISLSLMSHHRVSFLVLQKSASINAIYKKQNLRFLAFKNTIMKIKTLEERTNKETKFLKKWQIINNGLSS